VNLRLATTQHNKTTTQVVNIDYNLQLNSSDKSFRSQFVWVEVGHTHSEWRRLEAAL